MAERGEIIEIKSADELADLVDTGKAVVVKFWATWCQPCKRLAPHYKQAADKMFGHIWTEVDVDAVPDVADQFGVMSVPTIVVIKGDYIQRVEGRTVIQLVKELV